MRKRRRKYPIDKLNVGESILIKWTSPFHPVGKPANYHSIRVQIYKLEQRTLKRFDHTATFEGMLVTRIE